VSGESLTTAEKALYHQVHPAKLATDITSSLVSLWMFWNHLLGWGIVVTFVPPIVASALVIRFVDLEPLRESRAGRYLSRYMTPATQAARLAGAFAMAAGAWIHVWLVVLLGLAVIVAAWARGLARSFG
jgi:hypothetical protein